MTGPDRHCPSCGGYETETVELERQRGPSDGVYEILNCETCYAGFKIDYEPVEKELTHEPEIEP